MVPSHLATSKHAREAELPRPPGPAAERLAHTLKLRARLRDDEGADTRLAVGQASMRR